MDWNNLFWRLLNPTMIAIVSRTTTRRIRPCLVPGKSLSLTTFHSGRNRQALQGCRSSEQAAIFVRRRGATQVKRKKSTVTGGQQASETEVAGSSISKFNQFLNKPWTRTLPKYVMLSSATLFVQRPLIVVWPARLSPRFSVQCD